MNNNNYIIVRGACEHNLKSVNVEIPKGKITVITGLSGSGKSSLAFDTIYAEGQRRYVESLSAYARQFLEMQSKPNVESIEGLSPSISIEQKSTSNNPRSTVGTVTEIYDYMRLLWARAGIAYSPVTGFPIEKQSVSQIVDKILNYDIGTKILILAPIVRQRKGEYKKELQELLSRGFQRVKIDGKMYQIDETPNLKKNIKHDIEVIVDRIIVKDGIQKRLSDSVETTLSLSDGLIIIEDIENGTQELLSEKFADPYSDFTLPEITPRLFSFNSPVGACSTCSGIGTEIDFDPDLIIVDKNLSLKDGAVEPWKGHGINKELLQSLCIHFDEKFTTPWKKLSEKLRQAVLFGTEKPIELKFHISKQLQVSNKRFEGVIPYLKRRFNDTTSSWSRDNITNYQINKVCSECKGKRLKLEALCIKIADYNIHEASQLSIESAIAWFKNISNRLTEQQKQISERIIKEINRRLEFLSSVGLNYLTLDRTSGTLSGGESQRIRLASQIGSGLTGVLYVLDEPSIGLHQRDNERLLASLAHLRSLDNTVIVVEHDEDAIRFSDYLIDIGPGAGKNGGSIVASGTPEQVIKVKKSITAQYLNGTKKIEIPKKRRAGNGKKVDILGVQTNNLKNIDVSFPLGKFIAVTGVSGGGKSSLVIESLWKGIEKQLGKSNINAGKYKQILGVEHIDKVIDINQNPIGKTPRSNPVTYTGVFSHIRDWFAQLPEAKIRGYKAGRFSFNVKGGRCVICKGDGVIKIEMHFLPDIYVECEQCKAKRYNRETLEVMYKEKNIADILDMTVDEALKFFEANPPIRRILKTLQDVGLGYIHLGQQATTLSGGEAQRIKLAKELSKRDTGNTLYILDEPTTGLHFEDIRQLLEVLNNLVDKGNTVIVIEHNLDVIKTADYVIDIGPEGGENGGDIVAMGVPEQIVTCNESYTAMYLKKYLNNI